ncbi:MAG TPA: amidohydrolase [Actinomycetota bacterium]
MKTLYRASRVHTLLGGGEWVLVDERHVERVGSGEPPSADEVVDLPGTTIMPGFIDAHVHLAGTGLALDGPPIGEVTTREELLNVLRDHLAKHPGRLMTAGMDESGWRRPELPTIADLDGLSTEPLVVTRVDGYVSVANSAALAVSRAFDPPGAERAADGNLTGVLRGEANSHMQRWIRSSMTDLEVRDAQLAAGRLAASRGVTCVQEMSMPDKHGIRDGEILLATLDDHAVTVIPYIAVQDVAYVIGRGLPRIGGDLFLDGSLGARTAALLEPYADGSESGPLAHDDDTMAEFLHNAHLAGLQVGLHAIGDGAIEQALRVWERVYRSLDSRSRRHFRARRHRIEHFEMADRSRVERAGALGLAVSIQPAFDAAWGRSGGMYEDRVGPERAGRMNPFRTMIDRGLEVGAGSDSPVTDLDPMLGMWALESHHDPGQRLGRDQALHLFTLGAARIAHQDKRGRLEPGMAADLAAYDTDPMSVPDVRGLRPVLTVAAGKRAHPA